MNYLLERHFIQAILMNNLIDESCLKAKVNDILQGTVYSHVLSFLRYSHNFQPLLFDSRLFLSATFQCT